MPFTISAGVGFIVLGPGPYRRANRSLNGPRVGAADPVQTRKCMSNDLISKETVVRLSFFLGIFALMSLWE